MNVLVAVLVGALYAGGLYMMMRRSLVKLLIGLILLGHAANLLIFADGRLVHGNPPLVPVGAMQPPPGPIADPLPQALILTAIVIGFGVQAFAVVLMRSTYQTAHTDDLDQLRGTDREHE